MDHLLEISPSGRGVCQSCRQKIAKGELRFGEAVPSQAADAAGALKWHHLACAAAHKPEALRPTLANFPGEVPGRDALVQVMADAAASAAAPAPARGVPGALPTADLAPTGRAKCIGCEAAIAVKTTRIAVERQIDTGRFVTRGAGYLHPACVEEWATREGIDLGDLIAKVVAHSALSELPAPFGGAASPALAAPGVASPPTQKEAAPEVTKELPLFADVDPKTLREVAKKIDKLFDPNGFKHGNVLEKAGVPWGRRNAVYWYLAEYRLIAPETNAGLLYNLVGSLAEAPKGVIVPLLGRLNSTVKELFRDYGMGVQLLPRWIRLYDTLAVHALRTERETLEAAMAGLPPDIRLGVALVRGRSGLPIADADRKAIFKHLVHATLTKEARVHLPIQIVTGDAVQTAFELNGPAQLPRLAALFGVDDEAWGKAVAAGLGRGTWTTVAQVADGLRRVPLDALVTLVGKRAYLDRDPGALFKLLDARQDATAQVLAIARPLPADYQAGSVRILRELLLVWALSRRAAAGEPVPTDAANDLGLGLFSQSLNHVDQHPLRDGYLAALRALPRPDALALARRQLATEDEYDKGLPILAVHFDDALLREFIAKDAPSGSLGPSHFVLIGSAALPALVDAYGAAPEPKSRDAALAAIGALLSQGTGLLDPREQAAVAALGPALVDCSDDQKYWDSDRRDTVGLVLTRLDPARRRELLLAKLREATYAARPFYFVPLDPDRAFRVVATQILVARAATLTADDDLDFPVSAFGAEAPQIFAEALGGETGSAAFLRRLETALGTAYADFAAARGIKRQNWLDRLREMCAEAGGPLERIYLLEPPFAVADCALVPRAGSWSRLGGAGPGIPIPTRRDGEPLEHVLTIDLQEAPELTRRFPGARALALYVPDPRGGDDYKSSKLVAVSESVPPPATGQPLFVLPLDVPGAVFERRAAQANALLAEVRTAVFNRSGWALGEPIWVQEDEGDCGLVMQLADSLGLNLGDSGSLYVFDGSIFMQSH